MGTCSRKVPPTKNKKRFYMEARAIAYADDGYIKAKLSVTLQVLTEFKNVLKQDAGLELNVSKTSILPKCVTAQVVFDVAQNIIQATPQQDVLLSSFSPEGFVGIDDVDKLDAIQDNFIHYQLLMFCQSTRLQRMNSHILLRNRCVLQQQYWAHMVLHLPYVEGGFGVTFNDITKDSAF
jgi:hypothetical protein